MSDYKDILQQKRRRYDEAVATLRHEQTQFISADESYSDSQEAQEIIQRVAETIQQQVNKNVAAIVTRCLQAIFEDPYQFDIKFEQKRGKTDAVLQFIREGLVLDDPISSAGGGTVDVAAFALRLAALILTKPPGRRILVLDEPFSKIRGQANRRKMKALIEALSNDFGVQFVLNIDAVSYPEFLLGTVIDFS